MYKKKLKETVEQKRMCLRTVDIYVFRSLTKRQLIVKNADLWMDGLLSLQGPRPF